MKTLYVSDLDGTLLTNEARLSPRSRDGLIELLEHGLDFTVASLRSVESMRPILEGVPLRLPVIELNGAFVTELESGRKLVASGLDDGLRESLHERLVAWGTTPVYLTYDGTQDHLYFGELANSGYEWYCDKRIEAQDRRFRRYHTLSELLDERWVGVTVVEPPELCRPWADELRRGFGERLVVNVTETSYTPGFDWLTLSGPEATKGRAVTTLAERCGLDGHRVVSFGDQPMDITLFEASDLGVAVGNAHPDVLARADEVIGHHEEDAVVEFLMDETGRGP